MALFFQRCGPQCKGRLVLYSTPSWDGRHPSNGQQPPFASPEPQQPSLVEWPQHLHHNRSGSGRPTRGQGLSDASNDLTDPGVRG
eukprot:16342731-Heterocapsa_arctica.AAC.1